MKFPKFKAVMFDYDGTLTQRGEFDPSEELVATIDRIAASGIKVAVCTGRQLESFEGRFGPHFEKLSPEAQKNFYLFGENGAIGYRYDFEKKEFVEIYSGSWPLEIPKDIFREEMLKDLSDIAEPVGGHRIPFVLRPINALKIPIEEVHKGSDVIEVALREFIGNYEYTNIEDGQTYLAADYLHYGNSGLGCIVVPANADKDSAIKAFYEYLSREGLVDFEEKDGKCREIMVVGDNPDVSGNDHYFLKGIYGTAFTVGRLEDDAPEGSEFPIKALDENGKRIFHGEGTLFLLKKFFQM